MTSVGPSAKLSPRSHGDDASYRVSTAPDGRRVWWYHHETIPPTHAEVRDVTAEEAELIYRVRLLEDAGTAPPLELSEQLRSLLSHR